MTPQEQDVLAQLTRRFLAGLPDRVAAIAAGLATGDLDAAARGAHALAGTAGSYGFDAVGDAARSLERLLEAEGAAAGEDRQAALERLLREAQAASTSGASR